jgi:hypothetical protein
MTDAAVADALTNRVWLTIWPNHVHHQSTVHIKLNARFSEDVERELVQFDAKGIGQVQYAWRLDVVDAEDVDKVVHTVHLPIVRGDSEGTIDPSELPEGRYRVQANIVLPDGSSRRVWRAAELSREEPFSVERLLAIHRDPIPTLKTGVTDAASVLAKLRLLGSPGRAQFPGEDLKDSFGRGIWDLQLHDDRIYVGYGDGFWGRGPVDVYSFDPSADPDVFEKEFRIDDEYVTIFRDYPERLLIPGINATESWDFGNLYIKEKGAWRKLRTVPNGIHVNDVLMHDGRLYVTAGTFRGPTLYVSEDLGISWDRYDVDVIDEKFDWRFYEIASLEDGLLLTVEQEYFYFFKDGNFERVITPVVPGTDSELTKPMRVTPFLDGVLYQARETVVDDSPHPLYFIRSRDEGVKTVEAFRDQNVRDIVVRGGTCHVLVSNPVADGYASEILETDDLKSWRRIGRFESEAMAYSLETADGRYFVGMGTLRDLTIQESGAIYILE